MYIYIYIYAIMKAMCSPGYHHIGFVATHALGHMMYGIMCISCHKANVVITWRAHCFHDCIYITPILLLRDLSPLCIVDHLWPLIYNSWPDSSVG